MKILDRRRKREDIRKCVRRRRKTEHDEKKMREGSKGSNYGRTDLEDSE